MVETPSTPCTNPSDLVAITPSGQHVVIPSAEGSRQGDGPAGYFFSLPFGAAVQKSIDATPIERIRGFLDDLSAGHADPMRLLDFLETLVPNLKDIGLEINLDKCELVTRVHDQDVRDRATKLGIKVVNPDTHCVKVLGAPVGADEPRRKWCVERISKTADLCQTLTHDDMDPQLAYTMLILLLQRVGG